MILKEGVLHADMNWYICWVMLKKQNRLLKIIPKWNEKKKIQHMRLGSDMLLNLNMYIILIQC